MLNQACMLGAPMNRLSTALLAAISSVALTQIAAAADLPMKAPAAAAPIGAPYNWTGIYAGGHIGYLWGRTRVEEDGVVTEPNAATNGVVGGVLAGANWQSGHFVYGLEGDFGWTNAHGVGLAAPVVTPNTYDVDWTGHVRGRGGYAFDNWLIYAAGGLSISHLDFHEGGIALVNGTYFGWSIGGGVEYAITRNLLGRIEYLYDDFGHKDYVGATGDPYRIFLTGQTVRGALVWKFNPAGL